MLCDGCQASTDGPIRRGFTISRKKTRRKPGKTKTRETWIETQFAIEIKFIIVGADLYRYSHEPFGATSFPKMRPEMLGSLADKTMTLHDTRADERQSPCSPPCPP